MSSSSNGCERDRKRSVLKRRIAREFVQYWIAVFYLALFFGVFAWHRRLILAEHQISYLHYGTAVIEALVLAKVILIGEALGLGRGGHNKPLIYPTLGKTVVFSIFVGVFGAAEHIVGGWLHRERFVEIVTRLWSKEKYEILSQCLITFFAFIPFFAFKEISVRLGEGRLFRLFFRKNTTDLPLLREARTDAELAQNPGPASQVPSIAKAQ